MKYARVTLPLLIALIFGSVGMGPAQAAPNSDGEHSASSSIGGSHYSPQIKVPTVWTTPVHPGVTYVTVAPKGKKATVRIRINRNPAVRINHGSKTIIFFRTYHITRQMTIALPRSSDLRNLLLVERYGPFRC